MIIFCDSNCNFLYAWVRVIHYRNYKDDQWPGFLTSQFTKTLKFLVLFLKHISIDTSDTRIEMHDWDMHLNMTMKCLYSGTLWFWGQFSCVDMKTCRRQSTKVEAREVDWICNTSAVLALFKCWEYTVNNKTLNFALRNIIYLGRQINTPLNCYHLVNIYICMMGTEPVI